MVFRYFRIIPALTLFIASVTPASSNHALNDAWKLLLDNKAVTADSMFKALSLSKDPRVAAEAFRGQIFSAEASQNSQEQLSAALSAWELDPSPVSRAAITDRAYLFITTHDSDNDETDRINELANAQTIFDGHFSDIILRRALDDGDMNLADRISQNLSSINSWMFIGPFDNTSGCGFTRSYPPEDSIAYSNAYSGKDGSGVFWHYLPHASPSGWISLQNHCVNSDALFYFHTCVSSRSEKDAILSFGASGFFTVWLNGKEVLCDSVFRNTGIDSYMQKVHLSKGRNSLLVKIGHEKLTGFGEQKANFNMRILDGDFRPLNGINVSPTDGFGRSVRQAVPISSTEWATDTLVRPLEAALNTNPDNIDAALQLIETYSMRERRDEALQLIRKCLARYPKSALLQMEMCKVLIRSHRETESETALEAALADCPSWAPAWEMKLQSILQEDAQSPDALAAFLAKTPRCLVSSPSARIAAMLLAALQNRQSDLAAYIDTLGEIAPDNADVRATLTKLYESRGELDKAADLSSKALEHNRTNEALWQNLANAKYQEGKADDALSTLDDAHKFIPDDPDLWEMSARMFFNMKDYEKALAAIDSCLCRVPSSANIEELKGNVLASAGRKNDAVAAFKQVIFRTPFDFDSWESIRRINKETPLDSTVLLPDLDSLVKADSIWIKSTGSKPAVLAYYDDIFRNPSRSSYARTFLVINLPNQAEIDKWKEYHVGYNSNYQTMSVVRAFSRKKSNGALVPADHNEDGTVVFKSLEPGDCIVLEYKTWDYYHGGMSKQLWGSHSFHLTAPTHDSRLRFISPVGDTVPYIVTGDSIKVNGKTRDGYRIVSIEKTASDFSRDESFVPAEYPTEPKVIYSTNRDWHSISKWYEELSSVKAKPTPDIKRLVDSLCAGANTNDEKAQRIHRWLTHTINYSFVPFRQSDWVPQAADEVAASRIGDCKDMATLGACMFRLAGMIAQTVLVNTELHYFPGCESIGPDFDHCIMAYKKDDGRRIFVDFTDQDAPLGTLPIPDQGAVALLVGDGGDSLICLPFDSSDRRTTERRTSIDIKADESMSVAIYGLRTGVSAAGIRSDYRFHSIDEQRDMMTRTLSDDYSSVILDSLIFPDLDTVNDSLRYRYNFRVKNGIANSGGLAVATVRWPDGLEANMFPTEEKRSLPIDLIYSPYSISRNIDTTRITFPKNWKPARLPKDVEYSSPHGRYSLTWKQDKGGITVIRNVRLSYTAVMSPDEFGKERGFIDQCVHSDDTKIVFFTE